VSRDCFQLSGLIWNVDVFFAAEQIRLLHERLELAGYFMNFFIRYTDDAVFNCHLGMSS